MQLKEQRCEPKIDLCTRYDWSFGLLTLKQYQSMLYPGAPPSSSGLEEDYRNIWNEWISHIISLPIIGCWENRDTFSIMRHFITILLDLVTSDDVTQVIFLQEPLSDIRAKLDSNPSLAWRTTALGLRVRPKQFTHQPWKNTRKTHLMGWGSLRLAKIYGILFTSSQSPDDIPISYKFCHRTLNSLIHFF